MSEILFTPAAVLGLLTQISELDSQPISFSEEPDGNIHFTIGTTSYVIDSTSAEDISVDDAAVEQVAEINEEGYSDLEEDGVEFDEEPVTGGIIKELIKTLFIGGMVRLNNKMMSKDQFDAYVEQAQKHRR